MEKIATIFSKEAKGKVLDLGCGGGEKSRRLVELGFEVVAADLDEEGFRYPNDVEFKTCDVTKALPFGDESFNFVLLLEVVEHLKDPYSLITEINRILKRNGKLILSTPNILNFKSRLRFFFEGSYEFFREPPLDQINNPKENNLQLHIAPYRFHELEYLLWEGGFKVEALFTSRYNYQGLFFLEPFIRLQLFLKERRSLRRGGLDHSRINKMLVSKEVLYGRHLIIEAIKK